MDSTQIYYLKTSVFYLPKTTTYFVFFISTQQHVSAEDGHRRATNTKYQTKVQCTASTFNLPIKRTHLSNKPVNNEIKGLHKTALLNTIHIIPKC